MYEAFFRLQKRPFSATPDPGCLFAPEPIQKVLNDLMLRVGGGQGIGVLTGGAGLGKTLICRRLAREFEGHFTPILLASAPFPTRRELLQAIHFELGRRTTGEELEQRLDLISSLKGLVHSGRPAALIVDEAHLLNERLLEEIRSLATMSEGDEPLLRVVLAGQMPLEMRLVDPALEALNQRISCHHFLERFTRQESLDYVAYRMHWAGGDAAQAFSAEALDEIARASNGLPRCLNQLSDHSLLLAFVQDLPVVSPEVVHDALSDLKQLPLHWNDAITTSIELVDEMCDEPSDDSGDELEATQAEHAEPRLQAVSIEPTITIEIGGESSHEELLPLEQTLSMQPAEEDSPVDDSLNSPFAEETNDQAQILSVSAERVFREEFVEDRYASLDQRAPRLSRTFEETRLVGGGARTAAIPLAATPPQPIESTSGEGEVAAVVAGSVADDSRMDDEPASMSLVGAYEPTGDGVGPRSPLDAEVAIGDEGQDVEVEISHDVLDVCLELRNSIGGGWEADSGLAEGNEQPAEIAGEIRQEGIEYDVVEPERPAATSRQESTPGTSAAPGRYVPKPNYRNVFSRLRRRIGNPRRMGE